MPRDPLDEQRIVEEHAGLVRALVGRTLRLYSRLPGSFDRDDLECYGRIGLLHAARTFDDSRGVAFSTYAYKCIQNQIVGALDRARTNEVQCTSLQILIGEDEDTQLEDQFEDPNGIDAEEAVLLMDDRVRLLAAIRQLDPPYSAIIEKVYFHEMPLSEVARELRMSAHRVQTLHAKALKMLRRRLHTIW
jgi:RNA polymerase sporulation-specific sigma factor